MDHDWWSDDDIGGQGSLHDLRDTDAPSPRLAGLKSVSQAAAAALDRRRPQPTARRVGFHLPRR